MPKSLNDILKGVKKSTTTALTTGNIPGVDYADKMKDGRDFVAQHSVEKHADRVGNEDDVYAGANVKKAEMKRHGHEPKPKDVKVYNKNQQVGQPENVKEEVEQIDELQGYQSKKGQKALYKLHTRAFKRLNKGLDDKDPKTTGRNFKVMDMAHDRMKEEVELEEARNKAPEIGSYHKVDTEGSHGKHVVTNVADGVVYHQNVKTKERHRTRLSDWANASSPIKEDKMCESCGKSPCQCDSDDEPKDNGKKDKPGKRKLLTDKKLQEKLTKSTSAGEVISDFVNSDDPKFKGKSKEERKRMALGAYYGMHPEKSKKVNEALSDQRSSKPTSSDKAREKIFAAMQKKKEEKMKEEAAATETPITFPATNSREGFRV